MTKYLPLFLLLFIFSCKDASKTEEARTPVSQSETEVEEVKETPKKPEPRNPKEEEIDDFWLA